MIDAKDLRIGNLVWYECTTHVVRGVIQGGLVLSNWWKAPNEYYYSAPIDEHESISLTKEWLLRAGFSRNECYKNLVFEKGCMQLEWVKSAWIDGNDCVPIKIDTVHQLQNLYHALTGEELEIDLTLPL